MKKSTIAIFFLIVVVVSYKYNLINNKEEPDIIPEQTEAIINNYYIYGTKLNIEGTISKINSKFKKADLILHNKKNTLIYPINYTKGINNLTFNIADEINNGINLENINKGKYITYLRLHFNNKIKYYNLNNNTNYKKTTYYTLSKTNNKVLINTNNKFTLNIKNNNKKVYDIVLDPARGGIDEGTTGNGYTESDITMSFAKQMKLYLEEKGLKVKLTRTDNSLKQNEYFNEYNQHGRAIIPNEVHAKYLFSIHTNSSTSQNMNGLSIYTASNINYDFSTRIVENIINNTNIKPARSNIYSIDYGIYSHNFTDKDIADSKKEYLQKGYKMYNIKSTSNYLYMIRETGGIITGAYIDNRNKEVGNNPYYKSNVGVESYVIYLGYLTNPNDIKMLTEKKDEYAKIISNSIIKELKY